MSPRLTFNTAARILRQLRHDKRTIAMILVVPTLLMTLLRYLYDSEPQFFDRVGLILLGVFPFVIMFLLTSVAMLRERTSGTLERLLTTPIGKVDILLGYGIAFAIAATVQAAVVSALAYVLLGLDTLGPAWLERTSDFMPFRWIVDGVRSSFVGDFAASGVMWGTAWALALFALAVWWGTATFRKENA